MTISLFAINTNFISLAILLMMAWFWAYKTVSLNFFFSGCHNRVLFTFTTPVFAIEIYADFLFLTFKSLGGLVLENNASVVDLASLT